MKLNKKFIIFLILPTAILIAVGLFSFPKIALSPIIEFQKIINKVFQKDDVKILFVGDLMFDRGIRYFADKNGGNDFIFSAGGGPASGWETLSDFLKSNDLVVANLEGPITDEKSVSANTEPGSQLNYFFTFDPSVAKTLFKNNIKLVSLGNNHILNFESGGLDSTKKYLSSAGVSYFGPPSVEAGAPNGERSIIKDISGVKIAFVNYNEFYGIAEKEQELVINEIKKAKTEADITVIFCHWGIEYQSEPTNSQRELAQKFIDSGADLIIGSHPHVIQPMEEYNEKRIYYSLGNFIFDQYFSEETKKGLGVIVRINNQTKDMVFEEINFYLQPNGQTILLE